MALAPAHADDRQRRGGLFSLALFVGLNEALYDGPTPYSAADSATGASSVADYLERLPRLATLFVDADFGLLRWAPLFVLIFAGVWWLWLALTTSPAPSRNCTSPS